MYRSRTQELIKAKYPDMTLAEFQREAKLAVSVARKLWYSTEDGLERGDRLKRIDLDAVERVCAFLGCQIGDLLVRE